MFRLVLVSGVNVQVGVMVSGLLAWSYARPQLVLLTANKYIRVRIRGKNPRFVFGLVDGSVFGLVLVNFGVMVLGVYWPGVTPVVVPSHDQGVEGRVRVRVSV